MFTVVQNILEPCVSGLRDLRRQFSSCSLGVGILPWDKLPTMFKADNKRYLPNLYYGSIDWLVLLYHIQIVKKVYLFLNSQFYVLMENLHLKLKRNRLFLNFS